MSWGIGSYTYTDENGAEQIGYGFPWNGMNPNNFQPDPESCYPKEIENWERDKKEWNEQKQTD